MWEQFRGLALPLLGQHFPPELIKDNGDSIVFTSRRDDAPPDWLDAVANSHPLEPGPPLRLYPPHFHQNLKNSHKNSYHIFNLDHKDVSAAS